MNPASAPTPSACATASASTPWSATRFKCRTTADWTERLLKAGVPCGPIHTIDRMFDDPQVQHLGMARPMQHPELGEIAVVGLPMQFSRHPRSEGPLEPAPAAG